MFPINFKILIFTLLVLSDVTFLNGQGKDTEIRQLFSAVVLISDSIYVTTKYQNKDYQVILKDPISGKTFDYKNSVSGSGFIISKDLDDYLVTAEHVAKNITSNGFLLFKNLNGKNVRVKINKLIKEDNKKLDWYMHPTADVAVLHLSLREKDTTFLKNLGLGFIDYSSLDNNFKSLDRLQELTVFGYPFGLSSLYNFTYSPITKNLRPASDIILINRFDKPVTNPFFLLDDPSVGGFSGGPVMKVVHLDKNILLEGNQLRITPTIFGLIHGTINDDKGGFAAVVPSKNILETLDSVPSYQGNYIFYYPNGKIWSERIYKNGFPWEVLYNYNPQGKPQDKGTLKNGNGTLNIYDEKGNLKWVYFYKNGKPSGNSYILSDDEFKNAKKN